MISGSCHICGTDTGFVTMRLTFIPPSFFHVHHHSLSSYLLKKDTRSGAIRVWELAKKSLWNWNQLTALLAEGSTIMSRLNLVCVCPDSPDVCAVCHVVRQRSGFRGGHRSRQGRLKHQLPALLTVAHSARRENVLLWNLVFSAHVLRLHDKSQKQERKWNRERNCALSIVWGVIGHLCVDLHMQGIKTYFLNNTLLT